MASSKANVAGRMPEAPWAKLAIFRAIIKRVMATGVASPTPAACDSTMLRCRVSRSSAGMRTLANFPKPVLMPYTGSPLATMRATLSALACTAAAQAVSSTGWAPR
jgi:hypothetical protein